jgi:uncharacterized protein
MRSAEPIPGVAEGQIPPAFLDRLITQRNLRMRDRALPLLKKGAAYCRRGGPFAGKRRPSVSFETEGYNAETIE